MIKLNQAASNNVVATPTSGNITKVTVSGTLTFATPKRNTAKTRTVPTIGDDNPANETVMMIHTITGYDGMNNSDIDQCDCR